MRPKSRASSKRRTALRVLFVLVLLLTPLAIWSLREWTARAHAPGTGTTSLSSAAPSATTGKVSIALLLDKIRLFMMIHNISLSESSSSSSAASPTTTPLLSIETARYVAQSVQAVDASPESALTYHFNASADGELAAYNAEAERELFDDGYATHVARSKEFWDPVHALRRGYGSEGAVFVAIPFSATHSDIYHAPPPRPRASSPSPPPSGVSPTAAAPSSTATADNVFVHAGCTSTVRSLYQHARWPIGVNVATPQFMFTRASSDGGDPSVERVIRCLPPEFTAPRAEHSYGFVFKDNMRSRSVVIPLPSGRPLKEADASHAHARFTSDHAMRFALLQLYRGESYILFVNPGVLLVPGWDWAARLLYLQLPERGRAVLTSQATALAPKFAESYMTVLRRAQTDSAVGVPLGDSNSWLGQDAHWQHQKDLKAAIDADLFTLARMVVPEWLHALLGGVDAAPSAASLSATTLALRSLFGTSTSAAASSSSSSSPSASDAVIFRRTHGSLSPALVLDVLMRQEEADMSLPEVCATARDDSWLTEANLIDKVKLECAWLRHHHQALREALTKHMTDAAFISVVAAATTPPDTREDGLVSTRASLIGRQSRSLREMRYLRPAGPSAPSSPSDATSSLPVSSEMWSQSQVYQGTTARGFPYVAQLVGSTDFLFARAEAFAPINVEDRLHFDPVRAEPPGERVHLDPFLGLLTRSEEDVHLSAALWTHGWHLFAPTETVACTVRPDPTTTTTTSARAITDADGEHAEGRRPTNFMLELRQRTVDRLRLFFSCEQRDDPTCTQALGGSTYAPGTARRMRDYLKWTNIHLE